jgi:hypothetical protein
MYVNKNSLSFYDKMRHKITFFGPVKEFEKVKEIS